MRAVSISTPTVTGVGSLPFTDPDLAVQFVAAACPELPFWPQLPRRVPEEGMVRQFLGGRFDLFERPRGAGAYRLRRDDLEDVVRSFEHGPAILEPRYAAGYGEFFEAFAGGAFPRAIAVKGQITGPITLAHLLQVDDVSFAREPRALAALGMFLERVAREQALALQSLGLPVLLVVDEPGIVMAPSAWRDASGEALLAALDGVMGAIREAGAAPGIHCCTQPPFGILCERAPDVLSFDAGRGLEAFYEDAAARRWLSAGGMPMLGIVPTGRELAGFDLERAVERHSAATKAFGDPRAPVSRTLVSASCGLALGTVEDAQKSFEAARAFAEAIAR